MAQKVRTLKDLYFRFGESRNLDWPRVAEIMHRAGLIELLPCRSGEPVLTHYRDTSRLRDLLRSGSLPEDLTDLSGGAE